MALLAPLFVLVWLRGGRSDGACDATCGPSDTHYGVMFFSKDRIDGQMRCEEIGRRCI